MSDRQTIILTPEQEKKIIDYWNLDIHKKRPPKLKDVIRVAFGEGLDGRSFEGKAVKKFLSERDLEARVHKPSKIKRQITLTMEQEEFIRNNCGKMKLSEMVWDLFQNRSLSPLSAEFRAVHKFFSTLPKALTQLQGNIDQDIYTEYKPPKSLEGAIRLVNKVIYNANLDINKLTEKQKKNLQTLIGFLHRYRFKQTIENFLDYNDKTLFENTFVSYTYDKSDLTEEEVDAYINLCLEVVNQHKLQYHINKFEKMQLEQGEGSDGVKMSMTLAETVKNYREDLNKNLIRQEKAKEVLQGKRSGRLKENIENNATILNLVGVWKNETQRNQLIRYAEAEREANIDPEVEKLDSLDTLRAQILGISKEELRF